jgi:hypothetical protein
LDVERIVTPENSKTKCIVSYRIVKEYEK